MALLEGRKALVVGVANRRSIAWGIARQLHAHGAELCLTYQNERLRENVEELAATLSPSPFLTALDVTDEEQLKVAASSIGEQFGSLHVVVHSVAHAKREDLEGQFLATSRDGFLFAQDVSSYSLVALTRAMSPLLPDGASVMAITHLGSERVMPNYNVMGVAKASLEACVRYLAADLGPERKIRVNAISAGPLKTLAASGVKGLSTKIHEFQEKAPLREAMDPLAIGDAAVFLASDLSRAVTGDVLFVDNGFHVMGV